MPNTAKGTPYVISTDLVADYPTTSSALATHIDDKLAYNAVTINAQTGTTYTFALADASAGKLVTATNAASQTYTVPPQSSVTWADGAILRILNQGAGVVTIAAGAGVTINGTPLTFAQYSGAALQRTASNTWTIIPFTGGVGNADFSNAATGTYTSGGFSYKYVSFTATGTLTVTKDGLADVLVVGSGAGGAGGNNLNYGAGGGSGGANYAQVKLTSGTYSIYIAAGGAAGGVATAGGLGTPCHFGLGTDVRVSSGNAQGGVGPAGNGGLSATGYNGGTNSGGGGGATAVGDNNGGPGGAGYTVAITGTNVTYGTGGDGGGAGSAIPGGANTGDGGGAGRLNLAGGNGGSGIVIVRVRT